MANPRFSPFYFLFCFSFLLLLPGASYAQEKRYANGLYLERFSQKEGLPSQSTHCIVSSQHGELWLGSHFGLVQYDGYTFQLYPYSEASLPINYGVIDHLCEDSSGHLWFSVRNRTEIFRFDPGAGSYQYFSPPSRMAFQSGKITALAVSVDNELWIGTAQKGLYHFQLMEKAASGEPEAKWRHFPFKKGAEGPINNQINTLLFSPKGELWIATNKGLSRIKAAQRSEEAPMFDHFYHSAPVARQAIEAEITIALGHSPSGGIWVAGRTTGADGNINSIIEYFNPTTGQFQTLATLGQAPVFSLLEAIDGTLYIGTLGEGLYTIQQVKNTLNGRPPVVRNYKFEPPAAWNDAFIIAIVQGPFENIWFATSVTGLYKFNPYFNQFTHYRPTPVPDENDFYISCAAEGPGGKIWIGSSSSGAYCYDRQQNTFTQYLPEAGNPYSLASRTAISVFVDRDSNVWIGTAAGPNRYEPETGRFIRYPAPQGYILSIYQDTQGYLWMGTISGGLTILDKNGQVAARYRYNAEDSSSLSGNGVWQIFEDSRGDIYIPTSNGLNRVIRNNALQVDSLSFERIATPHPFVAWMHEDQAGHYWLSYMGFRFCRWNPADYSCQEYSLPSAMANAILEDSRGGLWLSAGRGIFRFDTKTETLQRYDDSYGIPFASLGRFGARNARGEIVLGAAGLGFTIFHPDSIRANPIPPIVKITDIYSMAHSGRDSSMTTRLVQANGLNLPFSRNSITVEYKALHFGQPEKIRYAYRMQGLDEAWVDAGSSRVARYSKLPSGHYIFEVKAASADGVWSETNASIPIHISPPWWRSGWAYGTYIFLLISAIFGYTYFQRKRWALESRLALEQQKAAQLQQMDAFKNRFFTNITHEFRTPLTIILGMAGQIRTQPQKLIEEGLDMITRNGKALLHLVNQMLDLARAESGALKVNNMQADIIPFLKYITDSFHSLAEGQHIELSFQSQDETVMMDYDPDKVQKICTNLIFNAIKFTPENGKVEVRVGLTESAPDSQRQTGRLPRFTTGKLPPGMDRFLTITVRDTGIGIGQEELAYIFDRFNSLSSPPRKRGKTGGRRTFRGPAPPSPPEGQGFAGAGTGIGLALAKELAELIGGAITVESERGKGAAFTVTLPITQHAAVKSIASGQEGAPFGGDAIQVSSIASAQASVEPVSIASNAPAQHPQLLIVEDNADVRAYLKNLLKDKYKIRTAPDGEAGIEKALSTIPDLIISDVMMPRRDGFELCQVLKQDRRTSHIPIILLTARADVESRLAGLSQGADAYLAKPFDQRELDIQLQKALELRRTLQKKYSEWVYTLPTGQEPPGLDAQFLEQARQVIKKNLDNTDFSIAELYTELGVSRTQCFRKFNALTGTAPAEFIRQYRLEFARNLLANQSLNISQVAYQAGFKDPAYFARVFQKAFGVSPSEFRRKTDHRP